MAFSYWEELSNSPHLDYAPGDRRAIRVGKIPKERLDEFVEFLLPASGLAPPHPWPGTTTLVVSRVHIEPFLAENQKVTAPATSNLDFDTLNEYGEYKCTVYFESVFYEEQLLLQHHWALGGEFVLIDSGGLEWRDGGFVHEDVKVGKLIPTIEHQIIWPRIISPPFAAMRNLLGYVNVAALSFSTGVVAPETFLFIGAELRREITSAGAIGWEVGYRFSERVVPLAEADTIAGIPTGSGGVAISVGGWNHFYRSESDDDNRLDGLKGFYRIWTKTDHEPIYSIGDLSLLFVEA